MYPMMPRRHGQTHQLHDPVLRVMDLPLAFEASRGLQETTFKGLPGSHT